MFRIFEVRNGRRFLLGGTPTLKAAQAFVLRVAGNPLLHGAAMGGYRGPNEFLPRAITGDARYEIVEVVRLREARMSEAA